MSTTSLSGSAQGQGPSPGLKTAIAPAPSQRPNDKLVLYILGRSVGRYAPPPAAVFNDHDVQNVYTVLPPTSASDALFGLLEGKLVDFDKYAGGERSAWLLDVAHGICDPRHERGVLLVYDPQQAGWTSVLSSAPLLPASYLYYVPPGHPLLSLTKICKRDRRSQTDASGNATTMRNRLEARDEFCWITGFHHSGCINSHICPKRLGDALAKRVLEDYVTRAAIVDQVSLYDPIFGLLLIKTLDGYFDKFEIGFKYRGPNVYECQDFSTLPANAFLTIAGPAGPNSTYFQATPRLHGFRVTPPKPGAANLPPPGLFRWHYIQCVVKKLKHIDYENFANIFMPMIDMPFASDDSISGGSDDYCDRGSPDWPTAAFDIGRAAMAEAEESRVRMESVAAWTAVSAGACLRENCGTP